MDKSIPYTAYYFRFVKGKRNFKKNREEKYFIMVHDAIVFSSSLFSKIYTTHYFFIGLFFRDFILY